jgi:hypothetical protein
MPGEWTKRNSDARMETADYIIRSFIARSVVMAIMARSELYRSDMYSKENMPKIKAYQNFIAAFSNAFTATRYNIKRSFKIPDWDDRKDSKTGKPIDGKDTKYNKFFTNNANESPDNIKMGLLKFDEFMEDLVRSGIYAILEETAIMDEGYEEPKEGEVE